MSNELIRELVEALEYSSDFLSRSASRFDDVIETLAKARAYLETGGWTKVEDGLPVVLKPEWRVEVWHREAKRLLSLAMTQSRMNGDKLIAAGDAVMAHLRTTPEGFVMAKAEPVAWLVRYTTHGQPRSQVHQYNAVGDIRALFDPKATVTELYAAPMLAASQESGT